MWPPARPRSATGRALGDRIYTAGVLYAAIALQWLHILAGLAWFGSSIFILFVMVPAVRRLSPDAAGEYLRALEATSKVFFPVVGVLTIVLGIVRGLLLGVAPGSPYGNTYLAAVILGIALLVYGALVTGRNVQRMGTAAAGPEQEAALDRTVRFGYIELTGFLLLLVLMVAMRFGY